jgi:hypothetical protein
MMQFPTISSLVLLFFRYRFRHDKSCVEDEDGLQDSRNIEDRDNVPSVANCKGSDDGSERDTSEYKAIVYRQDPRS